jgi:hypothetical protein
MRASRPLAYAFLHQPARPAVDRSTAASPPRRRWLENLTAWLVGNLDTLGEVPRHYLASNHLRRDIGLPSILPDGWPH